MFVFLFLSACRSPEEYGEARIIHTYEEKRASGRTVWKTVIQCLGSGNRKIISGKVGKSGDTYMSSWC